MTELKTLTPDLEQMLEEQVTEIERTRSRKELGILHTYLNTFGVKYNCALYGMAYNRLKERFDAESHVGLAELHHYPTHNLD